jgi:hypothetical protein
VTERPTPDDEQRDAAIDVAWRRSSDEEPSLAVDEAIRAAARRRIGSRPRGDERSADRGRRWTQWAPVAAAAGVAVLAFGLLRWLPVEQQFAPSAPVSPSAGTGTARDAAAEESAAAPAAPPAQTRPLADEPASAPSDAAIPAPRPQIPSHDRNKRSRRPCRNGASCLRYRSRQPPRAPPRSRPPRQRPPRQRQARRTQALPRLKARRR